MTIPVSEIASTLSEQARLNVFFDFDDTLSEQARFNPQYVRGIGDALAPIYGGDPEEWTAHGADMMTAIEADYVARFRRNPRNSYREWLPRMLARAAETLFDAMQRPRPEQPEAVARVMRREALRTCDALFPGARETVMALHERGIPLHMASGNDSDHLRAALDGVGLSAFLDRLYGPDLIDCAKEGPEFYRHILIDMRIRPSEALFIDNDPDAIRWALSTGANAIQVRLAGHRRQDAVPGVRAVVDDLQHIIAVISHINMPLER